MKQPNQDGFTLVELAIVLMIIGLLIAGVLRGQELLENSRVSSTVQQVTAYSGAKITFQDTYSAVPGDMLNARNRLPGCTDAATCRNGNGNNIVGDPSADTQPWQAVDNTVGGENTQFWKHLSLSHLIAGVNPAAANAEWGQSHPTAKIGGGFFARYSNFAGANGTIQGATSNHYIVLRNNIDGSFACGGGPQPIGHCVISPLRAIQIDRKMDDGIAYAGDVIAVSSGWSSGCGQSNSGENGPTGYNETASRKACDMMFKIK